MRERGKEEETEVCDLGHKHWHCDSILIDLVYKNEKCCATSNFKWGFSRVLEILGVFYGENWL